MSHSIRPCAGVTKLSDANDAGTRNSHMCTLILTEGDSAKSLAMSGLSVVGHDHWGVFPLRWAVHMSVDSTEHPSGVQQMQLLKVLFGTSHHWGQCVCTWHWALTS
jgi:DNA topoisomerase-2